MSARIDDDLIDRWRRPPGIFVVVDVRGDVGARIREVQRAYDPKFANYLPPHLTLAGSSGVGPIAPDTPVERLREALAQVAAETPAFEVPFLPPTRFLQTDIISLPLDPHGPLRELHERLVASGLPFQRARFAFTPHVTLNFYRTLTPAQRRELLALRVDAPFVVDHLRCSRSDEPLPPRHLFELPLAR